MSQTTKPNGGWGRGAALVLAIALLASLALLPLASASASYDPLASGTTKLTLDKDFLALMKRNGVKLVAQSPAVRRGATVALPVSEGEMDPTIGKGTADHEGVLIFERGKLSVPLKNLTLKTKRAVLQAKVGGNQLKVAVAKKIASKRDGFGTEFTATGVALFGKVATRLNKKLHLRDVFAEGQPLGRIVSKTQPQTIAILDQNRASIALDSGFVAKLNERFVAVNPISPAEHPGPFTFPIIPEGAIAPDASLGTLRTGGDLEFLQLGGGQIFWHELWLDLGARTDSAEAEVKPSPPYPGKQGRIGLLDLGAVTASSDPGARTITVSGAPLTLQAQTATTFNEAFAEGKDTFKAGEMFGTLSFTAQGQ